jgi:serine/threonine-protein kinase
MRDIFDVQDEIALAVVGALKVALFGDEKTALLKRYTDDAAVHELFLKGRYYSYKYSAEGWTRAIEFYQRALDMQPGYAPAHAGMAACYGCLWFFGLLPAGRTVPQSKAATRKALEVDGTLANAYVSLALITFLYDWEWERAEQQFRQSIALNSNDAEALSYYALFLAFEGRTGEALDRAQRALEVDPLAPLINMNVGWTYFTAGRPDEALDQAGKMIEIEPAFYGAYWLRGAIRLAEGRYAEAVEELQRAVSLGGHHVVVADLGSAYSLASRREDATTILDQLLETSRRQYVPAICMARVYSRLGATEKAFEWFEAAFGERNGELVFLQGEIAGAAEDDPLNRLGSDPRMKDLLRKMNLPQ